MGASPDRGQPRILFVNGFHRSGTTLTTSAVTAAVDGVTTTVGSLAAHIPALEAFLRTDPGADRGVDQLAVTPATAEEYGFLLLHRTGARALYGHPDNLAVLRAHIAELQASAPGAVVVLKNPWELGEEARLLEDFPQAGIVLLRRRLADVERSLALALGRTSDSAYARALEPDAAGHARYQQQIHSRRRRAVLLAVYRLAVRRRVLSLSRSVGALAPERIALLSYDELRSDPVAGARWAVHLVDPEAFAAAFAHRALADTRAPARSGAAHRALDRRWRDAWDRARAAQVRTGVLASGDARLTGRGAPAGAGATADHPTTVVGATSGRSPA